MDGGSDWHRKHLDDSPAELQAPRLTVSMSLRIPHLQEKKKKKVGANGPSHSAL